jgi:quercetin dioxygenase-like cupin family protein
MSETDKKQRRLTIYTREKPAGVELPASMSDPEAARARFKAMGLPDEYATHGGAQGSLLFFDHTGEPETRMMLGLVRMAAYKPLPSHSHDGDCLYYVAAGEIHLGQKVLRSGDGFFVPGGVPYKYAAGPNGAEVLEFRASQSAGVTNYMETPAGWERIFEVERAHAKEWADAGFGAPPAKKL